MLELFAVHFRPKTINLFSGLCKSGLYQNYGWLSFLKWPLRLLTFPTFKVLQGKRHDTVYMIILILSSIAAALEPFLFPLFLRLSARRHLRPSGAR